MSAVNRFFKDHGLEAIALGDLVAEVRKGLAASQIEIENTQVRVHMPTSIVVQALRMAQALRLHLNDSTTRAALKTSQAREQGRLLRACTTLAIMYVLFSQGGSGIDCLTEDLVTSEDDGIRMYHRKRNDNAENQHIENDCAIFRLRYTQRYVKCFCSSIHSDT
jgi:hypothetical protein